ncbi:unnamed protein product [Discula destructiva]
MDPNEMRFRAQHSPRSDATTMHSLTSPQRNRLSQTFQPQQLQQQHPQHQPSQDPRSNLSRRFTTDSSLVPTLSSNIGGPRGPDEYQSMHTLQLIEKKRLEFERILQSKRLFAEEMQKHEQETSRRFEAEIQKQEMELSQMVEEHGRLAGHQSEPTTPPEYRETTTGFPTALSRPNANRYSLSSLQSPPGMMGRSVRSGSILASPQSGIPMSRFAFDDQLPSWSQQASRRNSDEDEKEEAVRQDPTSHRSTNAVNRYSMPVTKSRGAFYDIDNLDQANTTSFLFRDDESTPESKLHSQSSTEDSFSALLRQPSMATVGPDMSAIGARPASFRHSTEINAVEQQKYGEAAPDAATSASNGNGSGSILVAPPKTLPSSFSTGDVPTLKQVSGSGAGMTPNHAAQQHLHNHNASMGRIPVNALRHSREMSADGRNHNALPGYQSLGSTLQGDSSAFIPTMYSGPMQGAAFGQASQAPVANGAANVPQGVSTFGNAYYNGVAYAPNGYGNNANGYGNNSNGYGNPSNSYGNALTGYSGNNAPAAESGPAGFTSPPGTSNGSFNGNFNGSLNGGTNGGTGALLIKMQGIGISASNSYSSINGLSTPNGYASSDYASQFMPSHPRDSQTRVIQTRRQQDNEAMNKYNGQPLSAFKGKIYAMCKDQHGCRYLQKQLESRDPETIKTIWLEVVSHVIELMTDPFGNYLCQKLFDYCNDQERTELVHNASKDLVAVAVNQHGTRALQKMIENLSNRQQVQMVTGALTGRVVQLIEDLNGNHVIQKCLNKLESNDANFVFDAVSADCVAVGTHRHGCCVIQRCIDHAEGDHKKTLIAAITEHATILVQDPYGNYVIQYIIDLNEPLFTNPLVVRFLDNTVELSCHKFSSNVIEKCLRAASDAFKDMIVDRVLLSGKMEILVRDQFGNYVIQTAIEHATPAMKQRLVNATRPMLPAIKNTAYGRKIQHKIAAYDSAMSLQATRMAAGQQTPADDTMGQISARSNSSRGSFGYRNGNNGSNVMNSTGNGNRAPQPFIPSTEITLVSSQRGMKNQSHGTLQRVKQSDGLDDLLQRSQPNQDFVSTPQRGQQGQSYTSGQRAQQTQDYVPASQYAQQGQDYNPAQRAQQKQNFGPAPLHTQQNQQFARAQQAPNRFGAFASRNGSPSINGTTANGTPANGTPVQGVSPSDRGCNVPVVPQNGDGTFF